MKRKIWTFIRAIFAVSGQKERHFKDDILRAKRNVFQDTGSPKVSWLIVSSIGQVSVECGPSIGQVSATYR